MRRGKAGTDRARGSAFSIPLLLCAAYAVLLLAWAIGNAPFTAPDEVSHYIRAIGAGGGQVIGRAAAFPVPANPTPRVRTEYTWINEATRAIVVPPMLIGSNLGCDDGKPDLSAACVDQVQPVPVATTQLTAVGNYQPLPYLLPGVLIRLGSDPLQADRLGRIGAAAECLLFLALAVWLLWGRLTISLIGVLAAVTPMVLFLDASVTPSGLEIAAGVAFAAAVLRLGRDPRIPRSVWAAAAVSGFVLCLSRAPGPLWVALDSLIFIGLAGAAGAIRRIRESGPAAPVAMAVVGSGVLLNRLYEHAYGSRLSPGPSAIVHEIGPGLRQLPVVLKEDVGVFGSLDSVMPTPAYALWLGLVVALIVAALLVGTWRERAVLAATAAGGLIIQVIFSALMVAGTTFDVQGRHMLPAVVMVPLLAGEVILRNRARLFAPVDRFGFAALALLVSAVHLCAWYWNARRQAVSAMGTLNFMPHAQWSPPYGWLPWLVVACVGALLLALSAAPAALATPPLPAGVRRAALRARPRTS